MKKAKNIFLLILSSLLLMGTSLWAQEEKALVEVEGILLDNTGEALSNVVVFSSEAKNFAKTDEKGRFKLNTYMSDVVVAIPRGLQRTTTQVSLGELNSDTIIIGSYGSFDVVSPYSIDYGKRHFDRLTGSVAMITGDELSDVPTIFVQEAMAGRLAGVQSNVSNSSPEYESHSISLWGNYISEIWVDGTPNSLTETTNEIDRIYIAKDLSSTSMLGGTGSEGAMMVDTRSGTPGDNRVEIKLNSGIKSPTFLPEMMNAAQYAKFYNKALNNDGLPNAFTDDAIKAYQDGSDPIRYPNINYYDYFLKDNAKYNQVAADVSGGGQTATYFAHLGYYNTESFDAQGEGRDYERFRVKSNLIVKLREFGKLDLGIGASFANRNYPDVSTGDMIKTMYDYPSNAVPLILNDSTFGYSSQFPNNLLVGLAESTVLKNNTRDIFSRMRLELDFGNLLEGLTFNGDLNVSVRNSITKQRTPMANISEPVFTSTATGEDTTVYIIRSTYQAGDTYSHANDYVYRNFYTAGRFNYDRVFDNKHYVTANALSAFTLKNGSEYEQDVRLMNYGLRANYAYKMKYVLEGSLTRSGNQSIKGNNQYSNFYSTGAAWVVSNEDFLKRSDIITYLKLRANHGKAGVWFGQLDNNNLTYYLDQTLYNGTGSYQFGKDGRTADGNFRSAYSRVFTGNPNLKWPERYVTNIGFDMAMLKNRMTLAVNVFNQKTVDWLILPDNLYALMGSNENFLPYVNAGEYVKKGMDAQINYSNHIGDFRYTIGANMMYKTSQLNKGNYISYPEADRSLIGRPIDAIIGLQADGLFTEGDDISAANQQFGVARVGDVKYVDTNTDGVINERDYHEIGHDNRIFYGLNLVMNYKSLTLGIHGDGAAGGQVIDRATWNRGQNNYQASVSGRIEKGELPRSTVLYGDNNYLNSTYWLRDAGYFNLRSINLAFTVPYDLSRKVGIEKARVYLAGKNLMVLSGLEDMYAPNKESGYSIYPIAKSFELGLEVAF